MTEGQPSADAPRPSPARVALVMTYPYEAFRGGEESYVAALRRYLAHRGHRVDTLVTDVVRGRTSPVLQLPGEIAAAGDLRVRRTVSLCNGHRLSLSPALLRRSAGAMMGRKKTRHVDGASPAEERWMMERLRRGNYHAVILMWGACRHVGLVSTVCENVLALKGFCMDQRVRLGQAPAITIPDEVVVELAEAGLVGMNNAAEAKELGRHLPDKTIIQVGMGFLARAKLDASPQPSVLFVGANSGANRLSLEWLLEAVWPRIFAASPDARLRVAGTVNRGWTKAVPPGVELLGRVESLAEEYRRAQVVVAPITVGTAGVKIKVAEALSYGRPLVCTSVGVDPGDPGQFGDAVAVADEPAAFADAVLELLADPELREARGRQSIQAFEANFSGAAAYGALSEHLRL